MVGMSVSMSRKTTCVDAESMGQCYRNRPRPGAGWTPRPLDSAHSSWTAAVTEHPHANAYRRAKQALESGDADGFLDWLAPEVVWWDIGATEPLVGRAQVATHLGRPGSATIVEEIHDLLANDEHLVALIHARVEHGEEAFSLSWAEVHHFDDEGRVAKRQAFPSDPSAAARLADLRR